MIQGNVSKSQTAAANCFRWQRCQRHATHMPFEHAGSQHVFVRGPAGRPGTVAMSKAGFRALHAHGLQGTLSVCSRRDNIPTDGRDVPSVRISLQSLITVSFFSVVCAFPERCLHISSRCLHTSSQRLSRHQWTLTQRTEHRHSSLKQRTHFRCLCIS